MEYSIGEFSKITALSIKALRFYHEKELLVPDRIDLDSGYRYYGENSLWRARTIAELRALDFGLPEIQMILSNCRDDAQIVRYLKAKAKDLRKQVAGQQTVIKRLEGLAQEAQIRADQPGRRPQAIVRKAIADLWIASLRFQGRYAEVGPKFGELFRQFGRYAAGAPFSLYYDMEFCEENADIEACLPLKKPDSLASPKIRRLVGGPVITLVHEGAYANLGFAYKSIFDYLKQEKLEIQPPIREIYLKGPGRFFPGNPRNYLTEIQVVLK